MSHAVQTLVVGIGSPSGDDRFGWSVAELLSGRLPPRCQIRRAAAPADLLDWLSDCEELIVCDACRGWGDAGKVVCWEWGNLPPIAVEFAGTHDLGLIAVLTLAHRLGMLPKRVLIWAVEAPVASPTMSDQWLTPCIASAADYVARQIAQTMADSRSPQRSMDRSS
jgi:hydrogenase maturation protease